MLTATIPTCPSRCPNDPPSTLYSSSRYYQQVPRFTCFQATTHSPKQRVPVPSHAAAELPDYRVVLRNLLFAGKSAERSSSLSDEGFLEVLELHRMIHVVIAVMPLCLWWYNPLDVFEPIMLDIEFCKPRCPKWSDRPWWLESRRVIRRFIDHLWLLPLPGTACDLQKYRQLV